MCLLASLIVFQCIDLSSPPYFGLFFQNSEIFRKPIHLFSCCKDKRMTLEGSISLCFSFLSHNVGSKFLYLPYVYDRICKKEKDKL